MDWAQASSEEIAEVLFRLGFPNGLNREPMIEKIIKSIEWCRNMKWETGKPRLTKKFSPRSFGYRIPDGAVLSVPAAYVWGEKKLDYEYDLFSEDPNGKISMSHRLAPCHTRLSKDQAEIVEAACPNLLVQYRAKRATSLYYREKFREIAEELLAKKPNFTKDARADAVEKLVKSTRECNSLWELDNSTLLKLMNILKSQPRQLEALHAYMTRNMHERFYWDEEFLEEARRVISVHQVMKE